jgi:signal transduction histidine kinase
VPPRAGRRRLGLRSRTALALAAGGLTVSVVLGVAAFQLARSYLLDKRVDLARQEAFLNARYLDRSLTDGGSVPDLLSGFAPNSSPALLQLDGRWYGAVVGVGSGDVPVALRDAVADGGAASQVTRFGGQPVVAVAVALPRDDARFFQFFPLRELPETLSSIRNGLVVAALLTTGASAVYGLLMSRQVLRPLREAAGAAERIAGGDLEARLDRDGDPDLDPLIVSFNSMVEALSERIAREQRFASDVSHELRTPLTSLSSAVHILDRRTAELGPSGREALDVVRSQVEQFSRLVLEILEMSRLEAGLAEVRAEDVSIRSAMEAVVAECGAPPSVLEVGSEVPDRVRLDVRRLRVTVRNLMENADRYAGGCTRLGVAHAAGILRIEVDDHGPGVPAADAAVVFQPFRRGLAASRPGAPRGTGLGLALVRENVRAMGGTVAVGSAPGGGARFTVELPVAADVGVGA